MDMSDNSSAGSQLVRRLVALVTDDTFQTNVCIPISDLKGAQICFLCLQDDLFPC